MYIFYFQRCFVAYLYGEPQRGRFGVNKSIERAIAGIERFFGGPPPVQDPDKTWRGPVIIVNVANGGTSLPESFEFGDVRPEDFFKVTAAMRYVPLNVTVE